MMKPEWMKWLSEEEWNEMSNEEQNDYRQFCMEGDRDNGGAGKDGSVIETEPSKPQEFNWEEWLNGERKMDECPVFMMPEWVSEIVYGKEV